LRWERTFERFIWGRFNQQSIHSW